MNSRKMAAYLSEERLFSFYVSVIQEFNNGFADWPKESQYGNYNRNPLKNRHAHTPFQSEVDVSSITPSGKHNHKHVALWQQLKNRSMQFA